MPSALGTRDEVHGPPHTVPPPSLPGGSGGRQGSRKRPLRPHRAPMWSGRGLLDGGCIQALSLALALIWGRGFCRLNAFNLPRCFSLSKPLHSYFGVHQHSCPVLHGKWFKSCCLPVTGKGATSLGQKSLPQSPCTLPSWNPCHTLVTEACLVTLSCSLPPGRPQLHESQGPVTALGKHKVGKVILAKNNYVPENFGRINGITFVKVICTEERCCVFQI